MRLQIERPAPTSAPRFRKASPVNVLKKLHHPLALVAQGFIAGGVLFWTTQGQATQAPAAPAPVSQGISAN